MNDLTFGLPKISCLLRGKMIKFGSTMSEREVAFSALTRLRNRAGYDHSYC